MKSLHKKIIFLEGILFYVMIIFAVTEHISEKQKYIAPAAFLNEGTEEKVADPYGELPKKIALTFDDGPDPVYTEQLLEGLKKQEVKATFFVMGKQAEKYPEIIEHMYQDGHLIGNHTYSHMQLRSSNREEFKAELVKTGAIIKEITGQEIQYVRPPYGTWDKNFESELNMFPVLWTVDPLDWCKSDAGCITQNIISKVKENDIILMHDQYKSSVKAALQVVEQLKKQNYEFVTVEELLAD